MTNTDNITAADFTAAADLIIRLRDSAIAAERDIRADSPISDYSDGIALALETSEMISPDTADAIIALIRTLP